MERRIGLRPGSGGFARTGGKAVQEYTLGELASAIGASLEGDPNVTVTGVARLDDAGPDDLSFLANPRYADAASQSRAGGLIADASYPANGQNVLRSENPYLAFARATKLIVPEERVEPGISPSAEVDPSTVVPGDVSIGAKAVVGAEVSLGVGVVIGAGAVIETGVRIGAGTRVFPRVTIHRGTRIGDECVIQSGTVLGSEGFGYAHDEVGRHHKVPQRGGLVLGDRVEIGANCAIDRGFPGDTVIGDGTIIDNLVHVAHNVAIGENVVIVAQVGVSGSTRIGDRAVLGGQAGLVGHIEIGAGARIGAQAGVIGNVPAGEEYSGYPARPHREQMRAHAVFSRLPELFHRVTALEDRLRDE